MDIAQLWQVLYEIDRLEAAKISKQPCPHCGGKVQRADYQRRPRGLPAEISAQLWCRFSFCCASCRRRVTPLSARFLGRKVYAGAIVVLVSALKQGHQPSLALIVESFSVPAHTARRWLKWWRNVVPRSGFWRGARAFFVPSLNEIALAASLVQVFLLRESCLEASLSRLLRFMAPIPVS